MIVCMLSCNGTDVWVWEEKRPEGQVWSQGVRGSQSHQLTSSGKRSLVKLAGSVGESPVCVCVRERGVCPVYSVKVRDMTVSEKCAGNIILPS